MMTETKPEYEVVSVEMQCLNCYAVWRNEYEVQKGENIELRAELISCPLCFNDVD